MISVFPLTTEVAIMIILYFDDVHDFKLYLRLPAMLVQILFPNFAQPTSRMISILFSCKFYAKVIDLNDIRDLHCFVFFLIERFNF